MKQATLRSARTAPPPDRSVSRWEARRRNSLDAALSDLRERRRGLEEGRRARLAASTAGAKARRAWEFANGRWLLRVWA